MKKITKTIHKEYDTEGNIIKHLETIIEEMVEEEKPLPYIPIDPANPMVTKDTLVVMYGVNVLPTTYSALTNDSINIK